MTSTEKSIREQVAEIVALYAAATPTIAERREDPKAWREHYLRAADQILVTAKMTDAALIEEAARRGMSVMDAAEAALSRAQEQP